MPIAAPAAPPETRPRAATASLLVAGGESDPNLRSLLERAALRGVPVHAVRTGPERTPALVWDVQADTLTVDGEEIRPTAAFLRYDVFHAKEDPRRAVGQRAQAWHAALHGWALAHPEMRVMNRGYAGQTNKPFMLSVAAACGLRIPRTVITNDLDALERLPGAAEMIAKPVPGGGYTQLVGELLPRTERREGRAASPAIVQERLVAPEVRIYGVGGRFIPFRVVSEQLDYRVDDATRVEPFPAGDVDPALLAALGRLMQRLGMEFGAADFKTHVGTGELVFLEINSGPMFAAFDRASGHAVSDAILDHLAG